MAKDLIELIQNDIIEKPIEQVMHESMIPYSEYVILDRALPRVEDGLKPVQRRILYSMYEMGLTPDKPYRKSAGIVGDCLGKYHPHGDTSVYDAMVRMAQPFNMRMTLVDGHGNFGSEDGDPAAAMRYTEARLTPLAMELLRDIDKETVSWSLNFDDRLKEPDMLPSRYPNLLVNGASGIAVGLATSIPPNNLGEIIDGTVYLIDNPEATLSDLLNIIKGPDFPTGGFVAGGQELYNAYETGKGKLICQAKMHMEDDNRTIVITEFPYQVNKAALQQKILNLRDEKKEQLSGISEIADESDRTGTRVVIRLKKECDPFKIKAMLLQWTDLRKTFSVNMVAIAGGKPKQMGLIEMLQYYINYQRGVIIKRTEFDLAAAKEKAHIVEGLVTAVSNIDEVIRIIKGADSAADAKSKLCERFGLSEKQAQAVLDMRLARLTKLEIYKLQEELEQLRKHIAKLELILGSRRRQMSIIKDEMLEIKEKFKSARKTVVMDDWGNGEEATKIDKSIFAVETRECIVVLNANNRIKTLSQKSFASAQTSARDCKEAHEIAVKAISSNTGDTLFVFTNKGNCHKIKVSDIPEKKWKERGLMLHEIIKTAEDEKIVSMFSAGEKFPKGNLLFYTGQGMLKKTGWDEYNISKHSFGALNLREGDELIGVEEELPGYNVLVATAGGYALNADINEIPLQAGRMTSGVKSINMAEGDSIVSIFQISDEGEIIIVSSGGYIKRILAAECEVTHRNRSGLKMMPFDGDTGKRVIMYSYVKEPYEIAVVTQNGIICVETEDLPVSLRKHKGKPIGKGKIKVIQAMRHYSKIQEKNGI